MALLLLMVMYALVLHPSPYEVAGLAAITPELRAAALITPLLVMPWVLLLRWRGRLRGWPVCSGAVALGVIELTVQAVWMARLTRYSDVYGLDMFLMDRGIGLLLFCVPVGGLLGLVAGGAFCVAAGVPWRRAVR